MKILSFNARVWTRDKDKSSPDYWKTRMKSMKTMIQNIKPDIICFQEMSFPANMYVPKGYRRVNISFSHPIYVKKGIKTHRHSFHIFYDRVFINDFLLYNVHGRWESKYIDMVANGVLKYESSCIPTIACGDFNTGSQELINRGFPQNVRSLLGIEKKDTFKHFTKPTNPDADSEIDHCFIWNLGLPKSFTVIDDNYGCERMSDHKPILIEF